MRKVLLLSLLLAAVAVVACRRGDDVERPPEDTFYLVSPSDDASDDEPARQAVCASDTAAYDEVIALIDQYNEAISDRIDALRLIVRATARQLEREGEVEIVAEGERGTLTLTAVQADDGSVSYEATFTPADGGEPVKFLEGSMASDRESGAWTILRPNGDVAVEVSWTRDLELDNVIVTRVVTGPFGTRESVYVRDQQTASIDFTGPQHEATVTWDRETKDGEITITDVGRQDVTGTLCWDADLESRDFCTIECP